MSGQLWLRWAFALISVGVAAHCGVRLMSDGRITLFGGLSGHGFGTGEGSCPVSDRPGDLAHLMMSLGMVAMFLPLPIPLAPSWWAVLFGTQTALLLVRSVIPGSESTKGSGRRRIPNVHGCGSHLVASAAMSGMFAVLPPDGLSGRAVAHAGHLSASSPAVAMVGWAALIYFLAEALICGVRVSTPAPGAVTPVDVGIATAHAAGRAEVDQIRDGGSGAVRLLMSVGMSYMLLTML